MPVNSKPFFTKLPARGLVQIEGEERYDFLQNLITNDIGLLKKQQAVYACLLNPQGKFLHDFFVLEGDGVLLLDCEGGARAQDLYKRLSLYKLRAKVQISIEEENAVYGIIGDLDDADKGTAFKDPRHEEMCWRSFEKPAGLDDRPFEDWDIHRIQLCVPDGSRDMEVQRATMLESNIDKLNGVSFEKGCYIGQELTARMHYRGLAKKHLRALESEALPAAGEDIKTADGKLAGEMRSGCGTYGIALLKDDMLDKLANIIVIC